MFSVAVLTYYIFVTGVCGLFSETSTTIAKSIIFLYVGIILYSGGMLTYYIFVIGVCGSNNIRAAIVASLATTSSSSSGVWRLRRITTTDLNDVIHALFDHDLNDTVHVNQQNMFDHGEVVNVSINLQSLVAVASSADVLLSTEANFSAIDTLVDAIRPTIVNNVLRRAVLLPNIAPTQRCVADEVLVALLVEASNVTATMEEVLKFT